MAAFQMKQRNRARKLCLQALYQWQLTGSNQAEIQQQFAETQPMDRIDRPYFDKLFGGVIERYAYLDTNLQSCADTPLAECDPIVLAALRMGAYELKYCMDVPYQVVVHESCQLAAQFIDEATVAYVNAVLDELAKRWRIDEMQRD